MQAQGGGAIGQYLIPGIAIAVILALRLRGMKRLRPLKLSHLWIVPVLYSLIFIGLLFASPPAAAGWAILFGALVVGGLIGWQRGKFMHIEVDPQTDSLLQRPSPAAILLLVGLVVVRLGARSLMPVGIDPMHGTALLVTDGLIGLALGMLGATRAEMYLRGNRLLEAARRDGVATTVSAG